MTRIRHLVLMSSDLERVSAQLREALGLGDPFSDPIAGEFGLRNEIFCLGDCFIEVCEPVAEDSPGRRHLARHGDSGYMVVFQVPDLDAARRRVDELGIRTVWTGERTGIAGMHLHPRDVPGAIVSMDQADPPESWSWGGPDWTGQVGTGAPGRIDGVTIGVGDPAEAARKWAAALGCEAASGSEVHVDGGTVSFVTAGERPGLAEIAVHLPDAQARDAEICGVRFLTLG